MKSMKSRDDSAKTEYRLAPLQSKAQVQDFLKAIQQEFVSKVDPLESGLQDMLIQRGVLTETDNESLGGGHLPTRGEKARHLWKLLYNISHEVFISDVLPVLREEYYHIIPARFWRPRDSACTVRQAGSDRERPGATSTLEPASVGESPECTRCAMRRRIRPSTLSDFAFKIGVITHESYCDLTKNIRISEPGWSTLFGAFAALPKPAAARHRQEMTTLLQRHSLHVPDNLVDLMTRGFPCQCSAVQLPSCRKVDAVKMKTTTKKRLDMWLLLHRLNDRRLSDFSMTSEASSTSVYPPSESEDGSHTSFDTWSLSSVRSELSETSLEQATAAGIPALPGLRQLPNSGNFRTENASDCTQVAAFPRRVDGVGTVSLPLRRGATHSQIRFNRWNTWHNRKGPQRSKLFASGENSLQGTPSGSQESLVSAILRELSDDGNPAEAHRLSSESLAETGSIDDSSDRVASGQPPDCVSRESQPDCTADPAPLSERREKPQQGRVDNSQRGNQPEDPSAPLPKVTLSHTFPRRSAKPRKTVRVSDFSSRVSDNEARFESERPTPSAQPPRGCRTNTSPSSDSNPKSQEETSFSLQPDRRPNSKPNSDGTDSSTPHSAAKTEIKRKVEIPTMLSQATSSPELAAVSSARQSSGEKTSPLSSPANLLPSKLSPDHKKLHHLCKALYKGDYERHHLVLRGTPLSDSDSNDCDISKMRQDDDVSQEKKSEQLHTSDVIPVEHLSHPRSSDLAAKHADESTALEKDSTENLHTSFNEVMCGVAVERARQNTDLMEFLDFASSGVTTTEELTQLLKKAVIVDVDARDEAAHLLEDYTDLECLYTELCPKLEELQQQSAPAETAERPERSPSPPPPEGNPHSHHGAAVSEVFQLCSQIQNSCENMLASRRTFIMCALYLNTHPTLTSHSTRDKAKTVARDAMVLLESTNLETWQLVHRLDELREELPSGVASSLLHEVISSMRTLLDSS